MQRGGVQQPGPACHARVWPLLLPGGRENNKNNVNIIIVIIIMNMIVMEIVMIL